MKSFLMIVLLISCIVLPQNTKACAGGGDYEDEYKYLFSSNMLSDTSLVMYFPQFTSCEICNRQLRLAIVEEWQKNYPSCSAIDIENAIFTDLAKVESLLRGMNPDNNNSFFNYLLAKNHMQTIKYLDFIAKENALVIGNDNSWESNSWEEEEKNIPEAKRLLEMAQNNLQESKDMFINQRYIFQITKLHSYLGNYAEAISFFEQSYPKNHVYPLSLTYYRTLGYYAGAKRKTNNLNQAKYLFATIFDKCIPIRYQAYQDFKFIDLENEEWEKSLGFATLKSERSAMLAAENIYSSQIDVAQLKSLYENDSSSYRLELALIKQLNTFHYENYIFGLKNGVSLDTNLLIKTISLKGEMVKEMPKKSSHWFVRIWQSILEFFIKIFGKKVEKPVFWNNETPIITYQPIKIDEEWVGEFIDLMNVIVADNKVQKPALFILAKGYLEIVKGDFEKGEKTIQSISSSQQQN
ncbi:MAG: hypothetical protein ACKVOU_03405, partial [Cytophagales bacterium]